MKVGPHSDLTCQSAIGGCVGKGVDHFEFCIAEVVQRFSRLNDFNVTRSAECHAAAGGEDVVIGGFKYLHEAEADAFGYFNGSDCAPLILYLYFNHKNQILLPH